MIDTFLSRIPLVRAAGGRIGQVAIVVEDMRRAIETWGVGQAGEAWNVWEYSPEMIPEQTYLGEPAQYSMFLAMNGSNPQFEYIQPLQGPSIYHTWVEQGGKGIHHLGFYVDDLETVSMEMVAAGFDCVMTGEGHGADGTGKFAYYDTRDLLGCYLEGIEVPARRREPLYTWPQTQGE